MRSLQVRFGWGEWKVTLDADVMEMVVGCRATELDWKAWTG